MPDERDQLAQAQAENATLQSELSDLKLRLAASESAVGELDEKTTEAINKLADLVSPVVKAIGKDGIKVAWPNIEFDSNAPGGDQQAATPVFNQYPVNLIENGVLRILTPFTLEEPPEPEVD